jgi:hypothetical protein
MGKLWWLFLILSLTCTVVNPYVGFFGLIHLLALFFSFIFAVNIKTRISIFEHSKLEGNEEYANNLQRAIKGLLISWCFVAVLMFIIATLVSLVVGVAILNYYIVTDTVFPDMAPFSLFPQEQKMTADSLLLPLSIVFSLLATVCVFLRRKEFLKMPDNIKVTPLSNDKDYGMQDNTGMAPASESKDHVTFTVKMSYVLAILAAAIIFGAMNVYVGWSSLYIHAFYLLVIFIMKVTIRTYNKHAKVKAEPDENTPASFLNKMLNGNVARGRAAAGVNARYMLARMAKGGAMNNLMIAGVWLVTLIIVATQVLSSLFIRSDVFSVIGTGMDYLFLVLSCVFDVALAILLSKSIRAIQ